MFRKRNKKTQGVFARLVRSAFATVILSAFVVGLALMTKELSLVDSRTFAQISSPVLSRLGFSPDAAGEVAGEFAIRFSQTGINRPNNSTDTLSDGNSINENEPAVGDIISSSDMAPLFKIALMGDTHEDWENMEKAIDVSKEREVDYIFYLGDFTNWGDVTTLKKGKSLLDSSGLKWEALPGDHDLAQAASESGGNGLQNFLEVFGYNYTSIEIQGTKFVLLDNSANFTPLDETRFRWFLGQVDDADFLVLSQPVYHPEGQLMMGIVNGEENEDVNNQRKILLNELRKADIKAVIAGDHHRSGRSPDEQDKSLEHIVIGALTSKRNIQTPRFSILNFYPDGTYDLEEIIL